MPDMDNHDEESKLHRKQRRRPPLTERNCCCRWLCCACCLPVWARCIVWFIIIGIIICIIVIGALLGTFKMPTVNLAGVTEFPGGNASQITYDGSVFKLNIGLIVNVNNPNVLPIHLSDMNATVKGPSLVSYDHHVWLIVTFFVSRQPSQLPMEQALILETAIWLSKQFQRKAATILRFRSRSNMIPAQRLLKPCSTPSSRIAA